MMPIKIRSKPLHRMVSEYKRCKKEEERKGDMWFTIEPRWDGATAEPGKQHCKQGLFNLTDNLTGQPNKS